MFLKKEDAINFLLVFQPFDLQTGCFLAAATAGFISILLIISKNNRGRKSCNKSLAMPLLTFIKTLTEQSDSHLIATCRGSVTGFVFLSTWLILMLIVGNEYNGYMTSSMTTSPIEPVPESIMDLVMNSKVPYFTTTRHWYINQT